MWFQFRPYVPVAQRRAKAAREVAKRQQEGRDGFAGQSSRAGPSRHTFWGKAWCDNLESYSDFANRLPRGRTYVRNGSVVDLQIQPGKITAMVSGSELYEVDHHHRAAAGRPAGRRIKRACAGQIGSLVELLQGQLSKSVIEIVTRPERRAVPQAERDQDVVFLSGLGRHVQARRRRHVRRRARLDQPARVALPPAQGRSSGIDRGSRGFRSHRTGFGSPQENHRQQ